MPKIYNVLPPERLDNTAIKREAQEIGRPSGGTQESAPLAGANRRSSSW
jgi:hypothetical protein